MTTDTTPGRPRRRKRRHAAAGARILAGGLSAATAVGLMGLMAGPATGSPSAHAGTADTLARTPTTARPPTVIIVRRHDRTRATAPAAASHLAVPNVAPATRAPDTATRGS
jgi:hypothetical protein